MYVRTRINQRIKELKEQNKRLKVDDFAIKAGIPLSTFNTIKSGSVIPKADTLEKIAVSLGVDMNYFFDNAEWTYTPNSQFSGNILSGDNSHFKNLNLAAGRSVQQIGETTESSPDLAMKCDYLEKENALLKKAMADKDQIIEYLMKK